MIALVSRVCDLHDKADCTEVDERIAKWIQLSFILSVHSCTNEVVF